MKGSLSLVEELRAIRGVGHSKVPIKHQPQPEKTERPWQNDIDRVERTLQDALKAISQISGVELPDDAVSSQGKDGPMSRMDCATLKDRIRNDLEAFSVTTVSEMAKQAEDQARAALAAVQNEVSGRIEQTIGEYREKLKTQIEPEQFEIDISKQSRDRIEELVNAQTDEFARWVWLTCKGTGTPIPLQVERLLEPYVEEATARVKGSVQQRMQELLAEQEKLVQEKLEGTANSFESHISTLEQAAQQICERNADSVTQLSTERLNAAADEAAKNLEGRIREQIEGSMGGIQTQLDEASADLWKRLQQEQDQRVQDFIHKIDEKASEFEGTRTSEMTTRIEQVASQITDSATHQLRQQVQELESQSHDQLKTLLQQKTEEVLRQIDEAAQSVHASAEQKAAQMTQRLEHLDEDLAGIRKRYLADSQEQLFHMVQEAVETLEPRVRQMANDKMEEAGEVVRKSQDEAVAQFESRLHEVSEGQYHNMVERIQKDAGEAGAQAASEVHNASQSVLQELSDKVNVSASLLREQQEQASSRFESSVQDTLDTFRQQLAQITEAGIEEHRKTIAGSVTDIKNRLRQAAEFLTEGITTV